MQGLQLKLSVIELLQLRSIYNIMAYDIMAYEAFGTVEAYG